MSSDALEAIEAFVALHRASRRRALPRTDRAERDALDEQLRDLIEGARPAPRNAPSPSPTTPSRPTPAPTRGASVAERGRSAPERRVSSISADRRRPTEDRGAPVVTPAERPRPTARDVSVTAGAPPPPGRLADAFDDLELPSRDARRLSRVDPRDLPVSNYTPARRPTFLDPYFDDAVDPALEPPQEAPSKVIDTSGEPVELSATTRDLWGIAEGNSFEENTPPPSGPALRVQPVHEQPLRTRPDVEVGPEQVSRRATRTAPHHPAKRDGGIKVEPADVHLREKTNVSPPPSPASPPPPQARPTPPPPARPAPPPPSSPRPPRTQSEAPATQPTATKAAQSLPPAIVHLLKGGTVRGFIERFEADEGRILVRGRDDDASQEVRLDQVLLIFFARRPEDAPSPKRGPKVDITLVNGKRVVGFSPDYRTGGSALTVVPAADRSGVDRMWIPAWSVKSIVLD